MAIDLATASQETLSDIRTSLGFFLSSSPFIIRENELELGTTTTPVSTVLDSTLTGQVSSMVVKLNGYMVKIPIIPV